jgi:hypothetical protein
LSTVDFIIREKKVQTIEEIEAHLEAWSDRKKTLFKNARYIEASVTRIKEYLTIKEV